MKILNRDDTKLPVAPGTDAVGPVAGNVDARGYRREHTGKLMVIDRHDGRALVTTDFFEFHSVGTHPTGLIVTGVFENTRRSHMMASAVRPADAAETAWLRERRN